MEDVLVMPADGFFTSDSDKKAFEKLMLEILDPLKPLYSEGGARLRVGDTGAVYGKAAVELEGFSRPLWALAPYWLGGGSEPDFESIYLKGLAAGSDPQNKEYWGETHDGDQCFVEMAAIACAILEVPEKVWEPLNAEDKKNLAVWLDSINHHSLPGCNWLFFMVLVNLALDSAGMPCDLQNMEWGIEQIDSWYCGDGWYTDGPADVKPQSDYYIPWAIQYYGILYSVFAEKRDPERAGVFRKRAVEFGKQFAYWFDENGAALPYGRSLTYRFAQCAFYSVCVFAGIEPLPLSVMKGIIVRNMQWWISKKIFDRDGILTIGYCYPQMYMAEQYNAPGSPYWCMKSFIIMALPEDHPFWSAAVAPLPETEPLKALKPAKLLMQRLPDGQVNAYSAAVVEKYSHGQTAEKYSKFVYNTRFGFSVSRSYINIEQAAPDSMLAFIIDSHVFVRNFSDSYEIRDDSIISNWSPFTGISVTTELIPCEGGHIRRHRIISELPERFECRAFDCGFAVPKFAEDFSEAENGNTAKAQNNRCSCTVSGNGSGVIIHAFPNTSLYDPNTVIPAVSYDILPGETEIETKVISQCLPTGL